MVDAPNNGNIKKYEIGKITKITGTIYYLDFPSQHGYAVLKLYLQNTKLYTKVNPDELISEKTIDYKISKKCKNFFKSEWEHGDVLKNYKDEIEKRNQDKITSSNHLTNTSESIPTDILPLSIEDHYAIELKTKDAMEKIFAGDSLEESSDEAFMKPLIVKKYKNKKSKLLIK
jgi:hypothetical protein